MKPTRSRVALYVRVSTRDQHLGAQLRELRAEARRRRWRVVDEVREVGSSRRDRPQLEAMINRALRRELDAILVVRLDRLGRSLVELVGNVERLVARGVVVVSVRDGALDTSSASAKLQLAVLGAVAEYEREVIRERTREGLARVRANGSASGRPIGRPPLEAGRLAAAAAWLEQERARLRAVGFADRALPSVRDAARKHELGATTLRRYLRGREHQKGAAETAARYHSAGEDVGRVDRKGTV